MGLLTRILGSREDTQGAGEGSEQMVESIEMREPEETGQSRRPGGSLEAPGGDGAPSAEASAPTEADDWEEIDVSDQLVDDTQPTGDLDASDLIIEDDVDDETSASVSAWGAVEPSEKLGEKLGDPASRARTSDVQRAPSRGERPESDPDRMRMSSEIKTPKQTVVDAGTEFKGTLTSSCPVVVNGIIDGHVQAPTLSLASTGAILGTVKAKVLRSQGTLSGSVDADEVFLSGAVRSKTVIKARRLEMKLGSSDSSQLEVTFGHCDLETSQLSQKPANSEPANSEPANSEPTNSEPTTHEPATQEPAGHGTPISLADGGGDSFTSAGWASPSVADDSVNSATAAESSGRSTTKSPRRSDALGTSPKRR